MKSTRNGTSQQCIENLMRINCGEVPFERAKGIRASLVDTPSTSAINEIVADLKWNISTYEPRVDLQKIDANELVAQNGAFVISAQVKQQ